MGIRRAKVALKSGRVRRPDSQSEYAAQSDIVIKILNVYNVRPFY